MDLTILLSDVDRIVYKVGNFVHKKRLLGLSYEYLVGNYINSSNNPYCVKTVEYTKGKLTTEFVPGATWYAHFKSATKYEDMYNLNLEVLEAVETLPVTHYDLHMSNVIKTPTTVKIIDFGRSSLPPAYWGEEKFTEGGIVSLSCGMIPSVYDPDFDKMLIVSALYKQSKMFVKGELERWCYDKIIKARFNNSRFFGYEHLIPIDYLEKVPGIYKDRLPLLVGDEEIDKTTLEEKLPLTRNSEDIYKLIYAYKRNRIRHRSSPSFKEIKDYM